MSHGIRIEDIAWQAWLAASGARSALVLAVENKAFERWWSERCAQGCELPACEKCGHDPSAKVARSWTIRIDRDPPSLNARLSNAGPRAYLYRRERDAWCWEFRAARLGGKIPKASSRRRVTLTRVFAGRQQERDADNLVGGMKGVVDALVLEGLLVDDAPAHAEIHYAQRRAAASERGLLVLIEEFA